jgi:NAD(P)-dependent dehydrogenase (short-subunit alcohol dehydrogenase family)
MNRRDHKVCVIAAATQGLGAAIARRWKAAASASKTEPAIQGTEK